MQNWAIKRLAGSGRKTMSAFPSQALYQADDA